MPNAIEVSQEIHRISDPHDIVREKYLDQITDLTGRNTIAYYSGFIPNQELYDAHPDNYSINGNDINNFMAVVQDLDKEKGLDLILHTPGGGLEATESIVDYLRQVFGNDIRAIVPQVAFSAGTMIALSCKSIVMGKHSSLGPTDPSIGPFSVYHIIKQFEQAKKEIMSNPDSIEYWSLILDKYRGDVLEYAINTRDLAKVLVKDWLNSNMLLNDKNQVAKSKKIIAYISQRKTTMSHNRHIPKVKAKEIGLAIEDLEANQKIQDAVLSFHHSMMFTFLNSPRISKIVQNNIGVNAVTMRTK